MQHRGTHVKESMAVLAPAGGSPLWAAGTPEEQARQGRLWRIRVLRFGVSKNRFLWTRPVVEAALALFDGVRVYADHQDAEAARSRKPRSVRELVGYIREPQLTEEGLEATLRVLDSEDWLRQKLLAVYAASEREVVGAASGRPRFDPSSISGPNEIREPSGLPFQREGIPPKAGPYQNVRPNGDELLGFSVDALVEYEPRPAAGPPARQAGSANPSVLGTSTIFEVKKILEVVSVDVVTTPSAGGRVLRLVASTPGWTIAPELRVAGALRPGSGQATRLGPPGSTGSSAKLASPGDAGNPLEPPSLACASQPSPAAPAAGKTGVCHKNFFHSQKIFPKEEAMTERVHKVLEAIGRMNPALASSLAVELEGSDEAIALDRVLEELNRQTPIHAPATGVPAAELIGAAAENSSASELGSSLARALAAAERASTAERRTLLAARLATSKLPVPLQRDIERRLANAQFTPAELDREIQAVREAFAQLLPDLRVGLPAQAGGIALGYSPADKMQIALDKAFGLTTDDAGRPLDPAVPPFAGIREAYIAMTGDSEFTGRVAGKRIREIFSTAGFPAALGNTLTRRLHADYREVDYGVEKIARFAAVNDFRTQERVLVGYFGDLPAVNPETADYAEIAPFTDQKVSYAVVQFGGIVTVTRKMIVNDDIGTVAKIVGRLGRAARRTLAKRVWNLLITNALYDPDGLAIFHLTHSNLGSVALSVSALTAAIDAMMKQTEKDSNERLGIAPRFLAVPIELRAKANEINQSRLIPGSTNNDANEHFQRFGRENERIIVNPLFSDANDWYLAADPAEIEGLEVGFLQGRIEPELFLADAPTAEQVFVADKIRYKIRHEYEADLLDFRAFYKSAVL